MAGAVVVLVAVRLLCEALGVELDVAAAAEAVVLLLVLDATKVLCCVVL